MGIKMDSVVGSRVEQHKLDRDEFVKSILDKSSKNSRLHKHVQGDEMEVSELTASYLPPASKQVTFGKKSNVDMEFEKALATPPPKPRNLAKSKKDEDDRAASPAPMVVMEDAPPVFSTKFGSSKKSNMSNTVVGAPVLMSGRVASSLPEMPKIGAGVNEDDLELENTIMIRKGEDMELPVAVIIPKSTYKASSCDLNYIFHTDAGDIQFTMLHVNHTNVVGDGSPRPAADYGSAVSELQPLQRVNTSQDATKGSLTLTESCTVILRWSNKYIPEKAQRVRYLVKMSYKHDVTSPVSSNIDDSSVPDLAFSPSWTQADRLEEVAVSSSNSSNEDGLVVSEDSVIERLRSHITGLEHQLYSVVEHNQKMTVEEGVHMDVFEALVERHKAGHEATHQALVAATKQNKWMRDSLEHGIRTRGKRASFSDAVTSKPGVELDDSDDTIGDGEPDEGGDSNMEWKDHQDIPGAPAASPGPAAGKKRVPSMPPSLDPALARLEVLQTRLEAVKSRMTTTRASHAAHQQQLSSHHHFYSNALRLKTKEVEKTAEVRDRAVESAKEAWAAMKPVQDAVQRLAVSETRLKEEVGALQGQVGELTRQVQAKQNVVSQLEEDIASHRQAHHSDKKALIAAHEKKADDTELFHDQQRNHMYTQLAKAKEELEKHKVESSMARIDLDKERKVKEAQLRGKEDDLEHARRLHAQEMAHTAEERDKAHAQELKAKAAQHAEDLQQAHTTYATAAANAIAAASRQSSPTKQPPVDSVSPVIRSLQELASSSPTTTATATTDIKAALQEVNKESIAAIDGAHKRAGEAEKALEALRINSKAREGKLLDRYRSLTDKYNDLLLRMEDTKALLKAKEEEASHAHGLVSQATGALSELKFKAGKHDEVAEVNRSLSESLLLLKEEHSKVKTDLSVHSNELSASKQREQHYADKISHMDAASPRKILDRNKSQIGQLQKQVGTLEGEKRDLLHMVELLNEEKHHRDEDYAKQHLDSSARISDLRATVDELATKRTELQDKCDALELRAMQGREAQTKVIDLSGSVGDLEAVLKHREATGRKLEAELAALKDDKVKTSDALMDLEDKLKASEERNVASMSQVKALSLAKSRLEKDAESLQEENARTVDDTKIRHDRVLADKTLVFERELRQAQEEHNRAMGSLEGKMVAALKRVDDTENQAARELETVLKKAEHRHTAEMENHAQRHSAALEEIKIRHSADVDDLKARHARVVEGDRAEAAEEIKTLEMEKARMKAALQAFREEAKGEVHLLEIRSNANAALHSQVETLKGDREALQARYDGQKSVIEKMKVELSSDSERLHNDDFELRNLRKERKEAKGREKAREAIEERLQTKVGEQEKALSALRAEVRRGEESKILLQTSTEQLQSELATAAIRLTQQEDHQDQQEAQHRQQIERLELENATLLSMVNETKAALALDESRLRRMEDDRIKKGMDRERRTAAAIAAASEPLMSPQSAASASNSTQSTPAQASAPDAVPSPTPDPQMPVPAMEPLAPTAAPVPAPAPTPVPVAEAPKEDEEDAAYRARLTFIYSRYAPEKLESISTIMNMYKGEDGLHHLFVALRRKYLAGEHAADGHALEEDEDHYSDDEDEREQKRENRMHAKQLHAAFDSHMGHVQAMEAINTLAQPPAPTPVRVAAPAPAPASTPTVDTSIPSSTAAKPRTSPVSQSPHSMTHLQKMMQAKRGSFDPHNPHPHHTDSGGHWPVSPKPPSEHTESPYDRKPLDHNDDDGFDDDEQDDEDKDELDSSFEAVNSKMNNLVGL